MGILIWEQDDHEFAVRAARTVVGRRPREDSLEATRPSLAIRRFSREFTDYLVVPDERISARHFEIIRVEGVGERGATAYFVRNLSSARGLLVDEAPCDGKRWTRIYSGAAITPGFLFRISLEPLRPSLRLVT